MLDATRGEAPNLTHLGALCHHLGVVQFAQGDTRDLSSGFCVDDNARALIVAVDVLAIDPRNAEAHRIGEAALALLERTQLPDGFHNLLDQAGDFIVEGGRSQDATGRAIWALGVTASRGTPAPWRERAETLLARQWSTARQLTASRARAYAMLGAALMAARSQEARRTLEVLGRLLLGEVDAVVRHPAERRYDLHVVEGPKIPAAGRKYHLADLAVQNLVGSFAVARVLRSTAGRLPSIP